MITTFSENKVSIYRLFDIGINCIAVTNHIVKGKKENNGMD
jgi:hypothetical protein